MTPRMDMDYEDSMDGPPPSVASVDSGIIAGTPKSVKKTPTGVCLLRVSYFDSVSIF